MGRLAGGPLASLAAKDKWNALALRLNALGEGAHKTGEQWRRYWSELKAKVKNKGADIRRMARGTGGGPNRLVPLTPLEEKILSLIGKIAVEGIVGNQIPVNEDSPSILGPEISFYESPVGQSSQPEEVHTSQLEVQTGQLEELPLAGYSHENESTFYESPVEQPSQPQEVQISQLEQLPVSGCSHQPEEVEIYQLEELPLPGCSGQPASTSPPREVAQASNTRQNRPTPLSARGSSRPPVPRQSTPRRPPLSPRGSRRAPRQHSRSGGVPSWAYEMETRRLSIEQQHAEALQQIAELLQQQTTAVQQQAAALTRLADTLERLERNIEPL